MQPQKSFWILFAFLIGLGMASMSAQLPPHYRLNGNFGLSNGPGNSPAIGVNGIFVSEWFPDPTGLQLKSTYPLCWASGNINTASDMCFSRIAAGQYAITALVFANLGTPANGTFAYCSDCTIANPCAGAGTG